MNRQSQTVLDRQTATEQIEMHLGAQCDMVRDIANYGADLVVRAYASSSAQMADVIALGVLLKQIVAMIDASDALIRIGAVHAMQLQVRAACEASFYLEWLLLSDSENKARHYYVASMLDQKRWMIRASKGTPENEQFVNVLADAGIDDSWTLETDPDYIAKQLERVNAILAQPELAQINAAFEALAKRRKGGNVQWYQPLGVQSIAQLAATLSRKHEYLIFYSKGSNIAHSGSYFDHVAFAKSHVRLKSIRSLEGIKESIMNITNVAMRSYRVVIDRYVPETKEELGQLWIQRWRKPFLTIPEFVFETK